MSKFHLSLARYKCGQLTVLLRKIYFKYLFLNMGNDVILGKILCQWPNRVSLGNNCEIEDNVIFNIRHPFLDDNYIKIGDRVYVGHNCEFNCNTRIIIGNDCLIASNTTFVDTGHEISRAQNINMQPCIFQEIVLGEDVWIGTQCIILKGVTIGNGSVIGAGSLVNKSIPPYQIWAGSPAKFIRNRY